MVTRNCLILIVRHSPHKKTREMTAFISRLERGDVYAEVAPAEMTRFETLYADMSLTA